MSCVDFNDEVPEQLLCVHVLSCWQNPWVCILSSGIWLWEKKKMLTDQSLIWVTCSSNFSFHLWSFNNQHHVHFEPCLVFLLNNDFVSTASVIHSSHEKLLYLLLVLINCTLFLSSVWLTWNIKWIQLCAVGLTWKNWTPGEVAERRLLRHTFYLDWSW